MSEETKYYRFIMGNVIVRRTGNKVEKKGKSGKWENAQHLLARLVTDDDSLIEISADELSDEEKS